MTKEETKKYLINIREAIIALERELCDDISEDGTLTVNVEDGTKVRRVFVCGDNHFGGLYYPEQESSEIIHDSTYGGVMGGSYKPQQSCDDAISRQTLIDALINVTDICVRSGEVGKEEGERNLSESIRWIKSLPPVNPVEKQESCKNVISREDTLKLIYDFKEKHTEDREKYPINYGTLLDLIRLIMELPPVNPTEKVGWWIFYEVHGHKACKCSECNMDVSYPCNDKFCKYCGSKMQEDE